MDSLVLSLPDYHLDDGRILFYQQDVVFHGNGLYLLKGKNGSGKTSLLSLLTGQEDREGLELYLDGEKVTSNRRASYFDQCVSYLPQEPLVFPDESVMENVLFPYDEKDEGRARSLLILLGLEECMEKPVSSLSFGEKQRLAFARMLYQPKRILLLDEIDSGLDWESASVLKNCIEKLLTEHIVILSTQLSDYDDVEKSSLYEIEEGKIRIVRPGTREENVRRNNVSLTKSHLLQDCKRIGKRNRLFYSLLSFFVLLCNVLFLTCGSIFLAFHDTEQQNRFAFDNIAENANAFLITRKGYDSIRKDLYGKEVYPVLDPSNHYIDGDYGMIGSSLSGIVALDDFSTLTVSSGRAPEREGEILVSEFCFEVLHEKKGVSLSDSLSFPMLSDYVIVGTYEPMATDLNPEYLKAITDDGNTFTYYRSMYLFLTETVFLYDHTKESSDYLVLNNDHTKRVVSFGMISRLSSWNRRILLDNHLSSLFGKERLPSICTVLFYFSLLIETLLVVLLFLLFSHQNRRYYLYERVSGMARKRYLLPNLVLYTLFSSVPYLLSVPFSYLILICINGKAFSSTYLLPLNYLPLSFLLCLVSLGTMALLTMIFLLLLFAYLLPKKLDRQLNALKRK